MVRYQRSVLAPPKVEEVSDNVSNNISSVSDEILLTAPAISLELLNRRIWAIATIELRAVNNSPGIVTLRIKRDGVNVGLDFRVGPHPAAGSSTIGVIQIIDSPPSQGPFVYTLTGRGTTGATAAESRQLIVMEINNP